MKLLSTLLHCVFMLVACSTFAQTPIEFIENKGQWGNWFQYRATTRGSDIFIENGIIKQIGDVVDIDADEIIEGENLCVSVGWFDMRVHAKEPGHEYKESLESMEATALAGGFSEIALLPNTQPVVHIGTGVIGVRRHIVSRGMIAFFHILNTVNRKQMKINS